MQTTAPHNVESDAIQLSDEYQAADVPPLSRSLLLLLFCVFRYAPPPQRSVSPVSCRRSPPGPRAPLLCLSLRTRNELAKGAKGAARGGCFCLRLIEGRQQQQPSVSLLPSLSLSLLRATGVLASGSSITSPLSRESWASSGGDTGRRERRRRLGVAAPS